MLQHNEQKCFIIVLLCTLATAYEVEGEQATATTAKIPKVQITRTALHVARSLDPDSTETVNVRTRTGDVATLIVRKRGGKSNSALPPPVSITSSSVNILEEASREGKSKDVAAVNVPSPVSVSSSGFFIEDEDHQRSGKSTEEVINIAGPSKDFRPTSSLEELVKEYNKENNTEKKTINVPPPVYIRSSPMKIKGEEQRSDDYWKRGRSVMHIDSDGIPVIHGVRMPDDESDRQTWRNARVINGILVPYDKSGNKAGSGDKQEITRKVSVHLEDPSTNKKTTEVLNPFQPLLYPEHTVKNKNLYNYPYASDTHARILEYINTVNQRETGRRRNLPPRARMIRFPVSVRSDQIQDEDGSGRSSRDSESQTRALHYPGSPIYPTSLLYTPPSSKISRVSFEEGVRTPVLQYAHPELGVQPAKVMRKHDDAEELDEAKTNMKRGDVEKANPLMLAYFAQDIHSDRSPYAYEPGMKTNKEEAEVTTADPSAYKRSSSGEEEFTSESSSKQWPKSSLAYLHEQYASGDSYGLANDNYIKRYPYSTYNTVYSGQSKESQNKHKGPIAGSGYSRYPFGSGHYTIHAHMNQERPLWERIGDTIREHVQTSMEKVSDMTRPVVEPLVEATHKISYNLGFAGEGNRNVIQDKVGSSVAAYPVLLPALGLVAGGAALGLGAVAVGRYLDVDIMKRRNGLPEDDSEELEVEHKRALESIVNNLSARESEHQGGTWVVAEEFKNPDEQKKVIESAVRALNDGSNDGNQDDPQRKVIEEIVRNIRERERQLTVTDDSTQEDFKIIEAIRSMKKPRDLAGEGTWMFVRNINSGKNEKLKQVVGRQGVWSRPYIINQDDQERKTIESIVGKLAEQEGVGQRQGSWILTEESTQEGNQRRKEGKWVVDKDEIRPNERQAKTKRSLNDGVIFVVEEDPDNQSRQHISMQETDVSKTHFRRERDLNQEILANIAHKLAEGSLGTFDIAKDDEFHTYNHRLDKRSAHDSDDITMQQIPIHSHHVISKRFSEDSRQSDNKEDTVLRVEDGEQYLDNILHSLESSQRDILASMARLDDQRDDWSNTPCAKKIFCDVMVKQSPDTLMLMEKKMATFLSL